MTAIVDKYWTSREADCHQEKEDGNALDTAEQPQPSAQQRISPTRLIQTIPKWNGCLLRCCHSVKGTSIPPIASSILMFTNDSERAPVTEQTSTTFYPRENGNGTVASICLVCFRTVGPVVSELQLSGFEREHVCESRYNPRRSGWNLPK